LLARSTLTQAIACCLGTLGGVYSAQDLADLLLGIDSHIKYDASMMVGAMMLSLIFQVCSGVTLFGSLVEAKVRLETNEYLGIGRRFQVQSVYVHGRATCSPIPILCDFWECIHTSGVALAIARDSIRARGSSMPMAY
jgi:hypothetical protein